MDGEQCAMLGLIRALHEGWYIGIIEIRLSQDK